MRFNNDSGLYVAHYTKLETAVDHILKNRSLRIGPLISTNDPRETKMWQFSLGSLHANKNSPSSEKLKELSKRNIDFNRILRNGYKVLCISQDAENVMKLDFSERSYGKPRMWAQYAENHRGVCLLFDKQVLHGTLESNFGREVLFCGALEYGDFHDVRNKGWSENMDAFMLSGDDIVTEGLEIAIQRHRDKYHDVFFFRKNKDWENETEYRWIIRGKTNDPEFIPIEDSLRAILLGVDYPIERLPEIHEYCKNTNTSLSRILWHNGMPIVQWFAANQLDTTEYKNAMEFHALIAPG